MIAKIKSTFHFALNPHRIAKYSPYPPESVASLPKKVVPTRLQMSTRHSVNSTAPDSSVCRKLAHMFPRQSFARGKLTFCQVIVHHKLLSPERFPRNAFHEINFKNKLLCRKLLHQNSFVATFLYEIFQFLY